MEKSVSTVIQELAVEKGGIYSALFGSESMEVERHMNINWLFTKPSPDGDGIDSYDEIMRDNIETFMHHVISQVVQSYRANEFKSDYVKVKSEYNVVMYGGKKYPNLFLPINYEVLGEQRFADIENYLDKVVVHDTGQYISINWRFPIYKIDKSQINTFSRK